VPNLPSSDPRFLDAVRSLEQAVILQRHGRVAEAERTFARLVKKVPDYFDALHLYGLFKFQTGQLNEALKLIAKAVKINPHSANALNSLGVMLAKANRHTEALSRFDAALKIDPIHVLALSNRCNSLNEFGLFEEACRREVRLSRLHA
jgi:predicted Zn-dependent protease